MAPAAAILSSLLALAPPDTPAFDVSDIEIEHGDASTHVTTYDADGEVSAEIVVWTVDDQPRIDAVWPDGLYMSVTSDGLVESDDLGEAVERLVVLETMLAGLTEEEAGECLGALIALALGCGSHPLACAVGAFAVRRWCVKPIQDDDTGETGDEETGS